ncbi:MAG: hypothetical protein V3S89_10755 [Desulfobacterales bacterium]
MTTTIDSVSESVKTSLEKLSSVNQKLFLAEKERSLKQPISNSPLLDQLCWVKLIRIMLADGHSMRLTEFKNDLKERSKRVMSWRKSPTIKTDGEFEGPMPWLHPFKLAGEALWPLEISLEEAVTSGQTEEEDLTALQEVLHRHNIDLPLQPQSTTPRFPPRPLGEQN